MHEVWVIGASCLLCISLNSIPYQEGHGKVKGKLAAPLFRLSFSIFPWSLIQRGGENAEGCLCSSEGGMEAAE